SSDYQSLSQRYTLGSLGRGNPFIGDIRARVDADGNITIENAGTQRFFQRQADGSFQSQSGDTAVLTLQGDIYQLREKNGTVIAFQTDGQLNFIQDPNGNRVTAEYSGDQLIRLSSSNGDRLTFIYNAQGRIVQATDQAGRSTNYEYDSSGELLQSIVDLNGTTRLTYNDRSLLASITDPNGVQQLFSYDAQGRVIEQRFNNDAEVLMYAYDTAGGITTTDANGTRIQQFLNDRGQVTQLRDELGRTFQFRYDDSGNLTRLIQPDNSVIAFTYDDRGNLLSQVNALGQRTSFTYDSTFNQLQIVTDARGNTIRYSYDNQGNVTEIIYADVSREQFRYDDQGNVVESLNRRSQSTSYTYNNQGQLLRQNNGNDTTQYTYDDRSNLTSARNTQGTIQFTYDSLDRLTRITYPNGRFLAYRYDAGGRRTQMLDHQGNTVNYRYDEAGRLAQLTDANNRPIIGYDYDVAGRLVRESNGNGTYTTYSYDAVGQLTNIINYAPNNSINSRKDYTYDALGRRTRVLTQDGQWTYSYDAIGQLTGAVFNSSNPDIPNQDLTYRYDAAGNRIRTTQNRISTDYSTNNLNQYSTVGDAVYNYDADGNLISKTQGNNTWSYTYDRANRLIRVTESNGNETRYEYDALGNRVATIYNGERTEYLVDPFGLGDVIGEYNGNGDRIASYTHGLGLVRRTDGTNTAYYDSDAIGSTVGLTGAAGNYINRYQYLPFGEQLSETETITNPFEFVGQSGVMEDPNGLHFMRARYYDSSLGRFTNPDPIGLRGGDANLYRYVQNNPVGLTDPEGTLPILLLSPPLLGASFNLGFYELSNSINKRESTLGGRVGAVAGGLIGGGFVAGLTRAGATGFNLYLNSVFAGAKGTLLGKGIEQLIDRSNPSREGLALDLGLNFLFPGLPNLGRTGIKLLDQFIDEFKGPFLDFLIKDFNSLKDFLKEKFGDNVAQSSTNVVASFDPNDIIAPAGFGEQGWIATPQLLPYTIRFENEVERATAPAVQVVITHQLDADLDLDTFELGDFGFGSLVVEVPTGLQSYSERLDLQETIGSFVDVDANLDRATRTVTWTLKTIDPETGELATGVDDGFLPPNTENSNGEGFVRYTVEPKLGLQTGDRIDAQASIVFDTNEPILTPPVFNTIDVGAPNSRVWARSTKQGGRNINLLLAGVDDGSGIASYDVYVSTNGGAFEQWIDNATGASVPFRTAPGRTYRFSSAAKDNVGHLEAVPTALPADFVRVGTNRKNRLAGRSGNDVLLGLGGNDRLIGRGGNDILSGGRGNDVLRGSVGNDVLEGGAGNDTLIGGRGNDTLVGGRGRDVFVLEKAPGRDVIRDFKRGQDRLGLARGISFDNLDFRNRGRNTLISVDNDPLALLRGVRANQITIADTVRV
ncbi:hypothetical protein C7B61_05680, partial [filamentous cyanobacterium CCP1]